MINQESWKKFLNYGGPKSGGCAPYTTAKHIPDFVNAMSKPAKVLDVGAGDLTYSRILTLAGCQVSAIDYQYPEGHLQNIDGIEQKAGEMHDIPYPNEYFDGIFANHVVEHALAPLIVFHEFNRVLKTGGALFIGVPDHVARWVKDKNSGHLFVPTKLQLENFAEFSGFELLKYERKGENEGSTDEADVMQVFLFKKVRAPDK